MWKKHRDFDRRITGATRRGDDDDTPVNISGLKWNWVLKLKKHAYYLQPNSWLLGVC